MTPGARACARTCAAASASPSHATCTFDAHVFAATTFAKHGIEFQNTFGFDTQFVNDAPAVITPFKASFGDAAMGQQVGRHGSTFWLMQLKHPSPLTGRQLQYMKSI
jgi:hypothetical protein